jgi:hypothetical protein
MSNMNPVGIPPQAVRNNPGFKAIHVGPPRGMSDDEVGTVEALVGVAHGLPVWADYWQPTPEQLAMLNAGGHIELRQYSNQMVMHSMTILPPEGDPTAGAEVRPGCNDPDCENASDYTTEAGVSWCLSHGFGPVQA